MPACSRRMSALALDIISDILINPVFDASELEREREVILQEIGQTRDTPDDLIFDYLQEACYPDQPMGWPIFGTEKTVGAFSRDGSEILHGRQLSRRRHDADRLGRGRACPACRCG